MANASSRHIHARAMFGLFTVGIALAGIASAQPAPAPTAAPAATRPTATQEVRIRDDQGRRLLLFVGQARILDAPWPVRRVSINDPAVADVDVVSPRRVQIQAKGAGGAEVIMWSDAGETWQAHVDVEADTRRLQAQLQRMFPKAILDVVQLGNVAMVTGTLSDAEQALQLHRFLELYNVQFVDATRVAGVQQVQLQVKVAEVSRTALRTLGFNAIVGGSGAFGGIQLGSSQSPMVQMPIGLPSGTRLGHRLPFGLTQDMTMPAETTMFAGLTGSDLAVFIQALAENQYLRILAEPTLVSLSGQEANFLVGGEFPIPIAQVGGGSGTTQISIEYKEFGVRLRFRPIVLANNAINLHVMPEVSELSEVGAVVVYGTHVPSLLTRRVETTLEVQSGQTFAIAGLIHHTDNARVSRVPGLGEVPLLGQLFRSVRYEQNETELLILVTASLVEPTAMTGDFPYPGILHQAPNAWELYGEGRLSAHSPARLTPGQTEQLKRLGLHKLVGPGGWASYENVTNKLAGEPGPAATAR